MGSYKTVDVYIHDLMVVFTLKAVEQKRGCTQGSIEATLIAARNCHNTKQIGCFNHRVVTMVAGKLNRKWLCIVYLLIA